MNTADQHQSGKPKFQNSTRPGPKAISLLTVLLGLIFILPACDDVDTPVGGSDLLVTPSSLDFGQVKIGESRTLSVRVSNNGSENITIAAQLRGDDLAAFSIEAQPGGVLAPGASADIEIAFSPNAERTFTASLRAGIEATIDIPLTGEGVTEVQSSGPTLVAGRVAKGPELDGSAADAVWQAATPLSLTLSQVESTQPSGSHTMTLKSVHDGSKVFFLVQVRDNEPHLLPSSWLLQGSDASRESDWSRRTQLGQDGFSFMFPISSNVQGDSPEETFETVGCNTACHVTEALENYEGGMYPTRGSVDIWYWKAGTTNPQGYADDYVASGSDGGANRNERRADAGRSFAQENFSSVGLGIPLRVTGADNGGLDATRYIWNDSSTPINFAENPMTSRAWANNDIVPGWLLRTDPNSGVSRLDVQAVGNYDGRTSTWTIEFSRDLNTQNSDDINFSGLAGTPFSVAYFDNTRKYANFEYANLSNAPRPSHFGTQTRSLTLTLQ